MRAKKRGESQRKEIS